MLHVSRRQLFVAGAALGLAATPLGSALAATTTAPVYRRSRFLRLVGLRVSLVDGASSYPAVLKAVQDVPGERIPGNEHRFILAYDLLRGPVPQAPVLTVRRGNQPDTPMMFVPTGSRVGLVATINNLAA